MAEPNEKSLDGIKHRVRQRGMTLKSWGEQYGYSLRQVSDVVRGTNKALYGTGKEIADKLKDDFSGAQG
ncbi:hypothetical protein JCM14076_06170 [Methylosoma difficile]